VAEVHDLADLVVEVAVAFEDDGGVLHGGGILAVPARVRNP
jgi:hypothetical protein